VRVAASCPAQGGRSLVPIATMARTLGSLLDQRAQTLVGRDREREALLALVRDDEPLVAVAHGVAGVGKTTLVQAFVADAHAEGAATVVLDAREVEPTERGFLAALARALGVPEAPLPQLAGALGERGERVVLVVDTYELLSMLDGWMSRTLVPGLPLNARVLLAGRGRPSSAWVRTYGELVSAVRVESLAPEDAEELLLRAGADPALNRLAHGHPLALQLAASALRDRPGVAIADAALDAIVEELARVYLDGLDDATRRALDAASVTRRTTLSLLDAQLPGEPAGEAFACLRRLPFVELGADGLVVHDTVREVVARLLHAADPAAYRRLRTAAWRRLRDELRAAARCDLWRLTADLLYLVERPIVRQFFFPVGVLAYGVEPARPDDWPAIQALAHGERDLSMDALEAWWQAAPEAFAVARDTAGEVEAFRCLSERDGVPAALYRLDPMLARWREHLRRDPVPRGGRVLFMRYLVSREPRSVPSQAQAALLLDAKRSYVELRSELRRSYAPRPLLDGADGACAMALGYVPLTGEPDDMTFGDRSLFNDFGPGSVDGWLADLAARELDVEEEHAVDPVRRQLLLDGERVDLTQLEFDVLRYLHEREGRPVPRDALLRDVWGYEWTGGSNVVEVAISALRRKLGDRAPALQTVRGVGYRLDALT
jgi:hypothetical protein